MDHTDITNVIDPATLATLNVRMPQLPTSSTDLSQQISDDTRKISRPCLNRVVTCVPTSRWVPDAHATQCMAPDCRQQFTFFNRKHHCRVCGKIFCTNCCSKQLSAPAVYAAALTTEETNRLAYQQYQQQKQEVPTASGGGGGGGSAPTDSSTEIGAARTRTHSHVRSTSSGVGGGGDSEKREGGSGDVNGAKANSRAGSASPTPSGQTTTTTTAPNTTVYLSSLQQPGPSMVSVKVCRECFYDHQLAICRRDVSTAEPRRRQRGELKMVQRARLIQICSYLPLTDLFSFSLVCSDFYFITRDNAIWIWHNAARWPDKRLTGRVPVPPPLISGNNTTTINNGGSAAVNGGSTGAGGGTASPSYAIAKFRPNSDDDLSYHCSYNFTQFLHYCHLLEATRCEGLSNFAHSARQLLSGYVKVVVIGPENIGKTLMIQRFLNGGSACVGPSLGGVGTPDTGAGVSAGVNTGTSASVSAGGGGLGLVGATSSRHVAHHHHPNCVYPLVSAGPGATSYRPTAGMAVSQKQVVVAGGLSLESSGLTIIDVAGHARYDKLRALACRGAHAIIMCYSVHSKKSLIDAAMQAFALEQELGPQPIIVCGIACPPSGAVPTSAASPLSQQPFEVTPVEAAPSSGRGRASIQVTPTAHGGAEVFSAAVQAILEKLMDGGRHASELLGLSTNPSVLDVLLDLKG